MDDLTVEQLAALPMEERVAYFLEHMEELPDPRIDREWVARGRARFVDTIIRRDAEQAAREAS